MSDAVRTRKVVVGLLISAAVLVACVIVVARPWSSATLPEEPPSIRGQITSITLPQTGPGGSILVEGVKEPDTQYDKASVAITGDTDIFGVDGKPGLSIGDLEKGMRVEAWFTGAVAESYPVQAQAEAIRVLAIP